MLDALAALAILSTTIVLSISALKVARDLTKAAAETRVAQAALADILVREDRGPGGYSGQTGPFEWRLTVDEEVVQDAAARLCQRRAEVRRVGSKRVFSFNDRRACESKERTD